MRRIYSIRTFFLLYLLAGFYVVFFSDSGLLRRYALVEAAVAVDERIRTLEDERERLAANLAEYRRGEYRATDFASAGYIGQGDRVVRFADESSAAAVKESTEGYQTDVAAVPDGASLFFGGVSLFHVRLLWGILSVITVLWYVTRPGPADEVAE